MEENQQNQPNNYEIKRQERLREQNLLQRKRTIRGFIKIASVIAMIVIPIGGFVWYIVTRPVPSESDIISKNGLHWHPHLLISIKGQEQEIPANIGIGVTHNPIHTHDNTGVIHLEMQGLVRKDDLRLDQFFKVWGKQFNSQCILDFCNGPEGNVKMLVNGKEITEFENYQMKDGDEIEIKYE